MLAMDMDLQTTDMLKIHVCNVEIRFFMIDFSILCFMLLPTPSQCYSVTKCGAVGATLA